MFSTHFLQEPVYGIFRGVPHIICDVMSCQYISMSFLPCAVSPKCDQCDQIVTKTWQHMIIWLLHQNKRFSTHFFFRNLCMAFLEVVPILFVMSCHVSMSVCHFCQVLSAGCSIPVTFLADSTWQNVTYWSYGTHIYICSHNFVTVYHTESCHTILEMAETVLCWSKTHLNLHVEKSTQRR